MSHLHEGGIRVNAKKAIAAMTAVAATIAVTEQNFVSVAAAASVFRIVARPRRDARRHLATMAASGKDACSAGLREVKNIDL